jgi:hypothetical protein
MAIDVVVEEVADNLEELAVATRRINTNSMGFFFGGVAVGAAIGFYFGYKFNKEKIKAEIYQETEEEIRKIREMYQAKVVAATPKPSAEEIIEERGYERPLKAPVPVLNDPRSAQSIVPPVDNWNYAKEMEERVARGGAPYIIHEDEYRQNEPEHHQVAYTFYEPNDILVDEEDEEPVSNPDMVVGLHNLKFGHGSDDENIVFVRNDRLQVDMEICRSYEVYPHIPGDENGDNDETDLA